VEHTPTEAPQNPQVKMLEELGNAEYQRRCEQMKRDGTLRCLTTEAGNEFKFTAISVELGRIPEDELAKVNVPKLDKEGRPLQRDGFVEHEERMVFKRQYERKRLLRVAGITEAQFAAWEKARAAKN